MNETLLTVICPPALEQALTGGLLAQEDLPGFTSTATHGHSSNINNLTPIEQVEGRQRQVMFQIHLDSDLAERAIQDLTEKFRGAKIHYWLTPVIKSGNLGKDSPYQD